MKHELVIFDLDDTLSESKTDITQEMVYLLYRLLERGQVGIISGCAYSQFEKQLLKQMSIGPVSFAGFHLMPSSGSQLFQNDVLKGWHRIYHDTLSLREKVLICEEFRMACAITGIMPKDDLEYGEIGEDRDSQITFSMLGQNAPSSVKKPYDPDQSKRLKIAAVMNKSIGWGYEATVGGATSIDVTRKGSNKASGVNKLLEHLKIDKSKVVFIADALFPGGNDHSVISTGVECIPTKGPEETKVIIKGLLGEE